MNNEFDYVISQIKVPAIFECDVEKFEFDYVEPSTLRIVITPFEDLKESFDRLIQQSNNYICVNAIAILDMVNICEKLFSGNYLNSEFVFVTYDNFEIARANIVHHSPVLEKIEHLVAFMISSKFISFKRSLSSAIEFIMTSEKYSHIFYKDGIDAEIYKHYINERCIIKIINLKEDSNGTS